MPSAAESIRSVSRYTFAVLLCFVGTQLVAQTSEDEIVLDSIKRDSIERSIVAEEIAALVPSEYASLIIDINEQFFPEVEKANDIIFGGGIAEMERKYDELSSLTRYVLRRNNVLEGIESIENKWRDMQEKVVKYEEGLQASTTNMIEAKKALTERRATWSDNQAKLNYGTHPQEIHDFVSTSLDTIDFYLSESAMVIDTITVIYTNVVNLLLDTKTYVDELKGLRQRRIASLLSERGSVIWERGFHFDRDDIVGHIEYLRRTGLKDARYYTTQHVDRLIRMVLFFLLFVFLFYWTRHRSIKLHDDLEPDLVRNVHILKQPFTIAILSTLIISSLVLPNMPPLISYFFSVLMVYCVFSIFGKMMSGQYRWLGIVLSVLVLLLMFSEFFTGGEHQARWLTLAMTCTLIFITFWGLRNRKRITVSSGSVRWPRMYIRLCYPLFAMSIAAFVANIVGYGSVAELINRGAILTLAIGLLLLAMYKSLLSVIYHFLHTTLARSSMILSEQGNAIFKFLSSFLFNVIAIIYIYFCLTFFLLWEPIYDVLDSIWNLGYTFGSIYLSVGDVVNVIIIIFIFWIVASITRLVLQREVFERVALPRGIGNAVSSLTHYTIIVLGIFLALATAGFEARHLGILAGALGIGIGFGLQNIVNNFLSGLILVFERPITVDDVVELDGLLGVVTRIGIRSSRIRQYNGDEVIVPNSDLISKRVVNRTLSDTRRRYTMTFETGRGVDPDYVIDLITRTAQEVEGILPDPPVRGYFKGMGAQSIKFYVNYWGSGNFLDLMSDVEKSVYSALEREGIQMPVPVQIEIQKQEDED